MRNAFLQNLLEDPHRNYDSDLCYRLLIGLVSMKQLRLTWFTQIEAADIQQ